MGKIDEAQHAIDHGVAQRQQGINGAQRQAVDELLEKLGHFAAASSGSCRSATLRACFENIPVGLAAERGGWLRCSPVTDCSRICALVAPRHPPAALAIPFPIYFQNTLYHC